MIANILLHIILTPYLLGALIACAIEVLVTESHVNTVNPRISVVSRFGADIVKLDMNGKPKHAFLVTNSVFHVGLPIPYGLNQKNLCLLENNPQLKEPVELQVLCGLGIYRSNERLLDQVSFTEEIHGKKVSFAINLGAEPPGKVTAGCGVFLATPTLSKGISLMVWKRRVFAPIAISLNRIDLEKLYVFTQTWIPVTFATRTRSENLPLDHRLNPVCGQAILTAPTSFIRSTDG